MKFSIIMASYNQVNFIEQAINSVLEQTYKNFELLIIDGGSNDGSINIINKYKNNHNITVLIENDKGLYHARNKGILMAKGDVISFLNTDDYYVNDALQNISNAFKNNNADIIYGITRAINKEGVFLWNIGQEFNKPKFISHYKTIPDPSTFIKRKNISLVGVYDTTLKFGADGDFWQRCMSLDLKFYFFKKTITNYRIYDETLTYNPKFKWIKFKETKKVHRRYYTKLYSPYIAKLYYIYYIKKPLSNVKILRLIYNKLKQK